MSIHSEATLRERNKWLKVMGKKEVENLEPDFDHWAPWDCMCVGSCSCHFKDK